MTADGAPTPFDPATIGRPELQGLYRYWYSRHDGARLPARADLDPLDIPQLLPHLMLIDVQHEPFDLRYRLVGTALVDQMGRDTTGLRVEDGYLGDDWPRIEQDYRTAVFAARPVLTRNDIKGKQGRRLAYERLLLPLSGDGKAVDMLVGGAVFDPIQT